MQKAVQICIISNNAKHNIKSIAKKMSKKSIKINSEKILENIKNEELLQEKRNTTFRLSVILMKRLKKKCDDEKVSVTKVIEQLIRNFLEN